MGVQNISKEDLFGIFYVRKANGAKWDSYFKTINALRALFQDKAFADIVSGLYLNVSGDFDSVRISYFVSEAKSTEAVSVFQKYFGDNEMTEIRNPDLPRKTIVAAKYGGKELEERFRYFLNLETLIGLELTKADLPHSRMLFATYCWQVRKASLPVREHFEPTFAKYSSTYASLADKEKEQFFRDMERLDWAHMMVNFVLGIDWYDQNTGGFVVGGMPLSIEEINMILKRAGLGFQIPLDWKP